MRSYPGFFAPKLTGASTPRPTLTPRDPGTYVFSLVVNDGLASSAAATVTVTVANALGPTPEGSGLIVQNSLNFLTLDETTMTTKVAFSCNVGFQAIDRRPDGVIAGAGLTQYYEINPVSGICSARGTTPEWIHALAVSAQGQVIGISGSSYSVSGSQQAKRLYKLNGIGGFQSYVYRSGASDYVQSIDFGPDGNLYGLGITAGGG